MEKKIVIAIVLFIVSMISIITSVSAGVIEVESQPTEVIVIIGDDDGNIGNGLNISILSPTNKTYSNKNISINVKTNVKATCFYEINNGAKKSLGFGTSFLKSIHLSNGNYHLTVKCYTDTKTAWKSTDFKIDSESESSRIPRQRNLDDEYEQELRTPKYGEWMCINNKLQRTVKVNGLEGIEYGQPCGFTDNDSEKQLRYANWLIMPIVLVLLILILIVVIAIALSVRE